MTLLSEEGILLRSHPYSETSRVLRFLTPDHGLLSVMARGLRRRMSKGEGGVETFDQVALVCSFRPERDLHTLRELKVSRSRRRLGRDLVRFSGASLLAELILTHTLQEASPSLHEGVAGALDALESAPSEAVPGIALAAGWRVLAFAGFHPVLDGCVRCGGELPSEGLVRFSAGQGGLLCRRCGSDAPGARMGPGARADLSDLVGGTPPARLRADRAHLGILEAFALHHLAPARPFQSVALLRSALQDSGVGTTDEEEREV